MDKVEQIAQANQVFTPGFPVHQRDLFSGRAEQLQRTIDALSAPGRHPVIFGQRGVGKTSLANILGQVLKNLVSVKVSCDGSDTFPTIWNRILYTASISFKQHAFGFSPGDATKTISLGEALGHDPSTTKPAEIAQLLRRVQGLCVIMDEFDKVADQQTKAAFADLIKILSDTAPYVTVILVGVAENIHELLGEHPSIDRNLVQIELPPYVRRGDQVDRRNWIQQIKPHSGGRCGITGTAPRRRVSSLRSSAWALLCKGMRGQ